MKIKILEKLYIVVLFAVLAGCDTPYGIMREADISRCPARKEVESLLLSIPEIQTVEYSQQQGGIPLSVKGHRRPDIVHTYHYSDAANVHGTLQFVVNWSDAVSYSQTLISLNERPPQKWIDATLPVMMKVEELIESDLGITNVSTSVTEWERM